MVRAARFAVLALAGTLLISPAFLASERAEAHPLHTSLAQLTYDPKTGAVQLSLRVFVDDFTKASIAYQQKHPVKPAAATPAQSPLIGYAVASFILTDAHSRRIAFTSCGGKRVGDLMWLCFKGQSSGGPLRVVSEVLFDTFRDQINIVQASSAGKTTNLLFTPGESAKAIP